MIRWPRLAALALVIPVSITACATPPPPTAPETNVEIAAAWSSTDSVLSGSDAAALQQDWWTDIGGAQLDSLVREALDANYSLAIAAANVEAARAGADIAGAGRLPQFDAAYDFRRREQVLIGVRSGPPGSDLLPRAHHGRLLARDRHGSRGGTDEELHIEGCLPGSGVPSWVRDGHGRLRNESAGIARLSRVRGDESCPRRGAI